jgi:hypothetical protein
MLIKRSHYTLDESQIHLVRPGEQVKTASRILPSVQAFIDQLSASEDYSYVLVNAMGYSEFYGANSNTDWYGYNEYLDFNGLLHAPLGFGNNYETDKMHGADWPYGYPSYYSATAYAHHKNTDPQLLGFGDVIFVAINQEMKRVELIIRVFNEEAKKKGHLSILNRIEAGERVDVSMGCRVPFDLCSICTDWAAVKSAWKTFDPKKHRHPGVAILAAHKAKNIRGLAVTRKDYCECMRKRRGQILPDGRKVFVYNDFPRFFDISFVLVGADKTAKMMWHLSGSGPSAPKPDRSGLSLLLKSSSIDKEIPGAIGQLIDADAESASDMSTLLKAKSFSADPVDSARRLLSSLASLGIIASPGEFQSLVVSCYPEGSGGLGDCVFDSRLGGIDDRFSVRPESYSEAVAKLFAPMVHDRSGFAPFLNKRLGGGLKKVASKAPTVQRNSLLNKIAEMYNGYRLSVLEKSAELFPKVAAAVPLDPRDKGIGPGGLLLGLGPVLHLLSAHLRKNPEESQTIGTMANLAATNPELKTVSMIGESLRSAMNIDKTSGLTQAAVKALHRLPGSAR